MWFLLACSMPDAALEGTSAEDSGAWHAPATPGERRADVAPEL